MDEQQQFDFLDIITILSFALQMQMALSQTSNDQIMVELHRDVDMLSSKLDRLLELCEENSTDADKHLSSAQ